MKQTKIINFISAKLSSYFLRNTSTWSLRSTSPSCWFSPHCKDKVYLIIAFHKKTSLYSFTGINESLPQTAYVKLIDVWMLFSMIFTFLGVILHSISQVAKRKERRNKFYSTDFYFLALVRKKRFCIPVKNSRYTIYIFPIIYQCSGSVGLTG